MSSRHSSLKLTARDLVEASKDYAYVAELLVEEHARVGEHVEQALDVSRALLLVRWLTKNGHQLEDAVAALNSIGLRAGRGRRWTVARLRTIVEESADVVEQAVAEQDGLAR